MKVLHKVRLTGVLQHTKDDAEFLELNDMASDGIQHRQERNI